MSSITPGLRLYSAVSTAEFIVVKAADVQVACAGEPVVTAKPAEATAAAGEVSLQLGKRYVDEVSGLLVMCTKGGVGPLTADGRVLGEVQAQALPSSD